MKELVIGVLVGIALGIGGSAMTHCCCEHHAKCCQQTECCPCPTPAVKTGAAPE